MHKLYAAALALFIYIFLAFGQATAHQITGKVQNHKGEPIEHATIAIEGSALQTTSDETGVFALNYTGDKAQVIIRAVGYQPLRLTLDKSDYQKADSYTLHEDNLNLNEVVVSASRYGMDRKKAPVIVNVLSPRLFNATQSVAMSETLNYQPGVRVETNCQNCGFSQVRLNGLEGAYSQILINSRAVFSALNSVYGLDQIPTSMIDRIEVVRSGGSALFGANAIAGTINIITKDPIENDWQIKSTNSLIGGKAWDNTVDFNTSYVENDLRIGTTFYGMHRQRQAYDDNGDGYSEITKLRNTTFGNKTFFKPSELDRITLDMSVLEEFRRGGGDLSLAPHFTDITEQLRTNSLIGGITYDRYSADWKHKISLYASAQKSKRESFYGGLGGGRTAADSLMAANSYGDTDDFAFVTGTQYTYNWEKDVFTAGVEYNGNTTEDRIPGYGRLIDQRTASLGTYAQYEWNILPNLKTLVGARFDYTNVDGIYRLQDFERNSDQSFGTFSPRWTLLYDITPDVQFRGGYARGFRAPQAFNEDMHVSSVGGQQVFVLIGEDLETEYSNAYTGSFNFTRNFGATQTNLLLEGFITDLQNPFTTVMMTEMEDIVLEEMRNGTSARVAGTNIELNIAPSSSMTFQLGGTIQQSKYKEPQLLFEGETTADEVWTDRFVRTPNTYGYLNSNFKLNTALSLDITGIYTGSMIVPHVVGDNMLLKDSPEFFEGNLRLGYTFPVRKDFNIELFGGVQNIFNAYQKDFDTGALRDSDYVYGPSRPRTVTFGIKIGHFHQ